LFRQHTNYWHSTTYSITTRTHERSAELGKNWFCEKNFRRAEENSMAAAASDKFSWRAGAPNFLRRRRYSIAAGGG
jgi:hypothetical protein